MIRAKNGSSLARVAKRAARAQRTDAQKQMAKGKREANMARQESLIEKLLGQLRQLGIEDEPMREMAVTLNRKWRLDLCWPLHRVAVELEGIGRHQTLGGFLKDCEKYNELAAQGWILIRTTHHYIADWNAALWIMRAIRRSCIHTQQGLETIICIRQTAAGNPCGVCLNCHPHGHPVRNETEGKPNAKRNAGRRSADRRAVDCPDATGNVDHPEHWLR